MNREEAIKVLNSRPYVGEVREALETLIPELRESKDERIRKRLIEALKASKTVGELKFVLPEPTKEECIAYLENLKDASKAIEVVDRIDKYIDEHLANAHDMKDSDPDKKYYLGWDAALGNMSGILQDVYSGEKQKEHQNNSDAHNESSWAGMISSSDKDKNLDEIAQDYIDSVKKYNPEPTWDLMQTAVCYGYHLAEQKEQKPKPYWHKIKAYEQLPCKAYIYKFAYEQENNFHGKATIKGYLVPNDPVKIGCDTWYLPVEDIKNLPKEDELNTTSLTKTVEQKPAEWNANDKAFIKDCANILVANDYAASAERLLSMFPVKLAELYEQLKQL